ncbi:hypothetical protein HYU10_02710 [Candidatus Woesearchaeota archaeon]|nr:hypothetical protein [Candidatus Woesearchaeota archaeon]MBI2130660.1 hypothetical protein [Candidatus Woesearchaeota archaeon]MBI2660788.1 hypothetical protein [Candidatus Woesearchaeota archaeon]
MEEIKKSVKVNCTFCSKEIECPEDMLQKFTKHMCYDCFQNAGELAKGEDLGEVHIDIPMDRMNEFIPENLTNSLVAEAFPDIWSERKEELKEMSKRDLAEEMFGAGAYIAIQQMLATLKQMDKAEDEKSDR